MLMVNQLTGFNVAGASLTETLVDRTTGTNIGNVTTGGGLASVFDGTTSQIINNSGYISDTAAYCGKTHASGKILSRMVVYGSSDQGFVNNTNPSITLTMYGKNGVPANATDGTALGNLTFTDTADESAGRQITSTDQSNSYTNLWVANNLGAGTTSCYSEIVMYELL